MTVEELEAMTADRPMTAEQVVIILLLFAGANVMPLRNFLFANAISSSVWAIWAGREFEHSHRHVAIFLVIIALTVIIAVGIFVHRREAQLIAEAERAMPGPLRKRS